MSNELIVRNTSALPVLAEGNSLVSYLEKIKKFPLLDEEEEHNLVCAFQQNGDLVAAQKLVTSHLRLAAKVALTYRRYGLPLLDIISEANIGLMQAVKKFDLDKKVRLATYAVWWIKAAINDYVLRSWSLVKIGTKAAQKKLFYNLSRIKARLGIYENRELEPDVVKSIAKELVVDENDVKEMNGRLSGDSSLNIVISEEDESERLDFLVDKRQNIEENVSSKEEAGFKRKILYKCLNALSEREQFIVKHRMLTDAPCTLEDIGAEFNISRERVRQIEKKAFERLSALVKVELNQNI